MGTHKFTSKDPILVFDFLTRYAAETDKIAMSEGQAYVLLTQFWTNPMEAQFCVVQAQSRYSEVNCWTGAVKYLL